jgi:Holliday junction resolvase
MHNYTVPLEKDFQRLVLKRLREIRGSWWVKINDRVTSGLPDIIGCVAGIFIAIELKTKSKVTALQAYTLKKIDAANGQTFVVNPENWPQVLEMILKFSALHPKKPTE